ncbi:hypothetical protein LguiB_018022 [Lonicera macranthoides]
MGLKIIKSTANGMNPDELEDNCVEMLEAEASLDHLCNVAPHSYSACGLGSDGTARLVQLVQEMQHRKILKSGDGSLYVEPRILAVEQFVSPERIVYGAPNKFFRQRYEDATGYLPFIFEGSSPSA